MLANALYAADLLEQEAAQEAVNAYGQVKMIMARGSTGSSECLWSGKDDSGKR
jgi:hypothetical protein